jgi:DNA-binding transcriptional regulator YbjK
MSSTAQASNTVVASVVSDSVHYLGRKASRRGSEQRRQNILDAAMRIIVRDGVRAVRHRAVAAEAAVPLSATTYYFKDINDLITDTFNQFVERSAAHLEQFWAGIEDLLHQLVDQLDSSVESRKRLADEVARVSVEYVKDQLLNHRQLLLAEQAFMQEALINPRLYEVAHAHRKLILNGVTRFFEVLGSKHVEQDAKLMTAIILRMEYMGLLDGVEKLDTDEMVTTLKRYMYLVLGL